jgi:ornithine decarboxylase
LHAPHTASDRERWIASAIRRGELESPCLVFDLDAADRILGLFNRHLPGVKLYYSVKANSDPTILQHLHQRGVGFDVASVNEIAAVLATGAEPEDAILSNTVKTNTCIREIFRRRISATTVDNLLDLNALALESTFHTFRPRILARIKLPPMGVEINLNEKFGCSLEMAPQILYRAHELGLIADGVHFHVGTQCRNVLSYRAGIDAAIHVLGSLKAQYGLDLRTIDIGGGFPDELVADENGGIEEFITDLGFIVREAQSLGYEIIAEPGRIIASGAGIAVSQVIGRNQRDGREWLYLDDGIYGLYSTAHYEKRIFEFVPIEQKMHNVTSFVVAGPTCDSLDVIGMDIKLPSGIKPGDHVLSYHAGAYSISVKSNFNGMGQISTKVSQHAVVEGLTPSPARAMGGS